MDLEALFYSCYEDALSHRYITNNHIEPLFKKLNSSFTINVIGNSVREQPIYGLKFGKGSKKILIWSQMHGNEATTTKALFDVFNYFQTCGSHILNACTIYTIPILNPDGAEAFTRVNANTIDLNRDAQNLSQPESTILRKAFDTFKPDFCFNLHGQRTIFSAGNSNNPATVSFLAPAQDLECTVTKNRKKAMAIIVAMNNLLQEYIPNQVGRYDDDYNINCVGDTFQNENVPTILFEAGHHKTDYSREVVRKYIFISLIVALETIINDKYYEKNYLEYFNIPENKKLFYDIIIRNAIIEGSQNNTIIDIAIQYDEVLVNDKVSFHAKIKDFGDLSKFYAHKAINANQQLVKMSNNIALKIGNEIDFVLINNVLFPLNLINN